MSTIPVPGQTGILLADDGGAGGGLPVMLVHSLAGNSSHWAAQLHYLRQTRRAVAIELRGHGRSDQPDNGDYSIAAIAEDVSAVVDALKLDRFVLVGHSMGGAVALSYAGQHPERVAGLVMVDPIGDGKQIPAAEAGTFLASFESDYRTNSEAYWRSIAGPDGSVQERLLADLRNTPQQTVTSVLREVMTFDPDPALSRYPGPKLSIVTPFNDMPFSLHRLGAGFPHVMVEGTGHWIQIDKPEVVNRLLDEVLSPL